MMDAKNIVYPTHTFKDSRMAVKIEQSIIVVSITDANAKIEECIGKGWHAISITTTGDNILILLQRIAI